MTTKELADEMRYRRDERLSIMGYCDPSNTPTHALSIASREAILWAQCNYPAILEAFKKETHGKT